MSENTGLIEILEIIKNEYNGVFFGSRAWGGSREDSDYDYVMPLCTAMELKAFIIKHSKTCQISDNPYYVSGYYIKDIVTGKVVNITGCKTEDFFAWKAASKMMEQAPCDKLTKQSRQMLFETILSILKKTI